jgi:hypothetical protein
VKRVWLDQGLAPNTAALLRLEGEWDAVHVSEVGMSRASDEEISRFRTAAQASRLEAESGSDLVVESIVSANEAMNELSDNLVDEIHFTGDAAGCRDSGARRSV